MLTLTHICPKHARKPRKKHAHTQLAIRAGGRKEKIIRTHTRINFLKKLRVLKPVRWQLI